MTATALEVLKDILSFDRPATKEKMVEEARNLLLACGHPVGNDFRPETIREAQDFVALIRYREKSA